MKKKLLFRADGNSKIGLGHLYRIFALIEFYKEDFDFILVTKASSTISIIPKEYNLAFIPENISINEEPYWLAENYSSKKFLLLADGYQFNSNYQKKIKLYRYTFIYIDDLIGWHYYADVIVNHAPNLKASNFLSEKYTTYALGTDFAILRPSFNEAAKIVRKIKKIKNVFVCFGGSDSNNLSLKAAKALLAIDEIETINIVLGGAYLDLEIYNLAKTKSKLNIYKNIDEFTLVGILKSCQLAIAPSSTILYEICSVKMPVLSGFYVNNQKNIYNNFANLGVIFPGGDFSKYSSKDFEDKILQILNHDSFNDILEKQNKLFDGLNKQRFLGVLNKLLLTCRRAIKKDLEMVYEWSNDSLVRDNSYNSQKILLKEHTSWFLSKINNPNVIFLIMEINKKPGALVRFDVLDEHSVIGIVVSKKYRGQKLAETILRLATVKYFKTNIKPILAYIKKENFPSLKAFENAGFSYYREQKIKNIDSYIYKLG